MKAVNLKHLADPKVCFYLHTGLTASATTAKAFTIAKQQLLNNG
jgi:hypothetical protein